jgi:CheY-like chemotaxis protein
VSAKCSRVEDHLAYSSQVSTAPVRPRILVVDDDVFILRVLRTMLEVDHDVETAPDGHAALVRLRAGEPFDLVLCDLMMPRVTGMEVYAAVAAELPALCARFLVITGGSADPRATAFLARREVPVLYKPFTTEELLGAVAARLSVVEPTQRGP